MSRVFQNRRSAPCWRRAGAGGGGESIAPTLRNQRGREEEGIRPPAAGKNGNQGPQTRDHTWLKFLSAPCFLPPLPTSLFVPVGNEEIGEIIYKTTTALSENFEAKCVSKVEFVLVFSKAIGCIYHAYHRTHMPTCIWATALTQTQSYLCDGLYECSH